MPADDFPEVSVPDVLAALRPHHVTVTVFGRAWDLVPATAYDWLGVLGYDLETLTGVVPGSVVDDQCVDMYQLALQHDDRDSRWCNAARVAVSRAGGRDWWWTVNLTRRLLQSWPYINGRLLLSGVDSRRILLPDFLDAAYMCLWLNGDDETRKKLDLELQIPPKGVRGNPQQQRIMIERFAAD